MAVVIAALLPVFLLIVLGFILKRTLIRPETQWHGLERLTYYVLFPVLLVQTLVKADLTKVPIGGVGGALFLSALAMSLLCLALRPCSHAVASTARPSPRSFRAPPGGRPTSRSPYPAISLARPALRLPPSR
jgi:predicted permease